VSRGTLGVLLLALAGCGGDLGAAGDRAAQTDGPDRFGFGAPADEARIARWDLHVYPDGAGLPPGRGTVAQGEGVYLARCAACHGPTGVEGPNNVLVGNEPWGDFPGGRAIGAYWPYATTIFDYTRRAMPMDAPGSLTVDETYAVVAWLLHRNEIVAADAVMDATSLPAVRMPARDRFVPDDRLESDVVR